MNSKGKTDSMWYGRWTKVRETHYSDRINLAVGSVLLVTGARTTAGALMCVDMNTLKLWRICDKILVEAYRKDIPLGEEPLQLPASIERGLREDCCGVHNFL